ncbi:MAG: WhiB family transcriptional regulator [Streptosporangiaceae bacterium]
MSTGTQSRVLLADQAGPAHWSDFALCAEVDPELFFPEKGGTSALAKRVCRACPVRTECLEDALGRNEKFGIRGGLSERERSVIRRRRIREEAA